MCKLVLALYSGVLMFWQSVTVRTQLLFAYSYCSYTVTIHTVKSLKVLQTDPR